MKRVLLTGMSGVGKSAVAARLSELGYKAIDTDHGGYSVADEEGINHWDLDRIRELLVTENADVLFVVGTDERQGSFSEAFDLVVLLSAPRDVMVARLAARADNPFGKTPDQLAKILADLEMYEPMIRRTATHEIDTDRPLDEVIAEILRLIGE